MTHPRQLFAGEAGAAVEKITGKRCCPYCGSVEVHQEAVDIGVGWQAVTSPECGDCGASQDNNGKWGREDDADF